MQIIFDGQLSDSENSNISFKDRGVQLGEGLFETMLVRNEKVVELERHWSRLVNSSLTMGFKIQLNFQQLKKDIKFLIKINKLSRAGLRLTVTPGFGKRGLLTSIETLGHYFIEPFHLPNKNTSYFRLCFSGICSEPTNPLTSLKSLSYMTHVFVKKEAVDRGFDDAIQLTPAAKISEISCANIFMIKDCIVYTPPLCDGLLPGITRARVIEYCLTNGIKCMAKSLSKEELFSSQSVFVTNALIGVLQVDFIEDKQYLSSKLLEEIKLFINT